ncbi:MAG: type II secretion system GspH family protein [Verrucomicrobiota bacterium]|nr:MAG: type II secretion system GspH family protein [Verrucomicrobiota bacterium]
MKILQNISVSQYANRKSFSLLELTVVIGILAILICLAIPNLRALTERSQRATAAANLRTIALAHINFIRDHGHAIRPSDLYELSAQASGDGDANLVAALLAKYGYISDVSVWMWDFDPLTKKNMVATMYDASSDRIVEKFRGKQSGGNTPLSVVCCIAKDSFQSDDELLSSKIPCCYSRGLSPQGQWNSSSDTNSGIWGDRGGLIAFFDGHVEWFPTISGRFQQYGTNLSTDNLNQAFPEGAYFVSWQGKEL